jgi:hypothetical protein
LKKSIFIFGFILVLIMLSACSQDTINVEEEDIKAVRHPINTTFIFEHLEGATLSEPKYQYTIILKNTSSESYHLQFEDDLKFSYDFILKDKSETISTTTGTNVWNKERNEKSFLLAPEEEMVLTKGAIGDIMPSGKYLVDFQLFLLNEQFNMKFDFEVD